MKIKNIIFDLGNVLLTIWSSLSFIEKTNCIKNPEIFRKKFDNEINQAHIDNNLDFFELIAKYTDKNKLSKNEMIDIIAKNKNEYLIKQLPKLKEKYNIYILSDIMKDFIPYFLNKHKINKYFDWIIESCNVWYRKPQKEIFEIILKKYNLNPKETIFFDDKEKNIVWAEKLWIKWVLYNDFKMNIEEILIFN